MSDIGNLTGGVNSHQRAVAALRYFQEFERELWSVLADPDLGKADMKSKVVAAITRLRTREIASPAQSATLLATFPDRPLDQQRWAEAHFTQAIQGADEVLERYRAATPGNQGRLN